jgi:alginate O-acetyltransferase complex protein AlgI
LAPSFRPLLAGKLSHMAFLSTAFVVFFAVVLLGLRLAPSRDLRRWLLLVASGYFYATWKPAYLLVLAAPIVVDYLCAIRIEESDDPMVQRRWLTAGIGSNILLLGYFKYTNFFLGSVAAIAGLAPRRLAIVLPLGISFFTFKAISYLIEVYRGELGACRSFLRFATYVSYFPDLLAGPIIRASVFLPQMRRSLRPTWPGAVVGSQMILLGLAKKLLIADQMAIFADPVFAEPSAYSPLTVWSAVVAYSLQIYCDFSGYSDMAIGMSKIIGIDLPENFNMPYLAQSPIDFWRRWHMTLTNWLRDYVYFSLPGLRKSRWNRYRNAAITALLGGLWHGASWTFVSWGALHGLAVGVNHWWIARRRRLGREPSQSVVVRLVCWLATYSFLCVTWVVFRSPSFQGAGTMLRKMVGLSPGGIEWFYLPLPMVLPIVIAAHAIGVVAARNAAAVHGARKIPPPHWAASVYERARARFAIHPLAGVYVLLPLPGFIGALLATSWVLALLLFGATGSNPFIYFQF